MRKIVFLIFGVALSLSLISCGRQKELPKGYTPSTWRTRYPGPVRDTPMTEDDANHMLNNILYDLEDIVASNDSILLNKTYDGDALVGLNLEDKKENSYFTYNNHLYKKVEIKKTQPNEISASIIIKYNLDILKETSEDIKFQNTLSNLIYCHIRGEGGTLEPYNKVITEDLLVQINDGKRFNLEIFVVNTNLEFSDILNDEYLELEVKMDRSVK